MSLPEKENTAHVSKKEISIAEIQKKMAAFCAYQERCISEVKNKLDDFQLTRDEVDLITDKLVKKGYIDEKRFAEAFVRGRFHVKKWGKVRIRQELKMRDIPDVTITNALALIEDDEYMDVLNYLAEKKWSLIHEPKSIVKKAKVQRFLMFRGFETDLIRDAIEQVNR